MQLISHPCTERDLSASSEPRTQSVRAPNRILFLLILAIRLKEKKFHTELILVLHFKMRPNAKLTSTERLRMCGKFLCIAFLLNIFSYWFVKVRFFMLIFYFYENFSSTLLFKSLSK